MNRVLNVLIVSGLACTLACAPGSRHQSGVPAANNNKGKPGPAPSGAPGPQDLDPAKATAPIVPTKGFDPSTATLTNAVAFPNVPEGGMTLIFDTIDSKKLTQKAKIIVDVNSDITNADSTLTGTYGCEDSDEKKTPRTCTDGVFNFTWNKLPGQAEVKTATGLKVTEAIDKTPATKQFGTGDVLNLSFTLNNSAPFKRTSAAIISAEVTRTPTMVYDDKQTGTGAEAATTIGVFGLPKVGLDGTTPITPTEPLSVKPETAARVSPGAALTGSTSTENQLIYTLKIQNQNDAKNVQSLTLTISIPLTDEDKADAAKSDADKIAADSKTKPDSDTSTTIAPKPSTSTSPGSAAAGKADGPAAPTDETDAAAAARAAVGGADTGTPDVSKIKPAVKTPDQVKQTNTDAKAKLDAQAAAVQAQKDLDAKNAADEQARLLSPDLAGKNVTPPAAQAINNGVTKSCAYDAKAIALPSAGYEIVKQQVEFVNGQPNIILDNRMAYLGWRNNYCDGSTGRIAVLAEAPGAVPCLAKAVLNDHNETIIFKPTDGTASGLCGGRMTHYVPGVYDTVDNKTACEVKALDKMKMSATNEAESDGHKGHIVDGQHRNTMTDMGGNPGQYQYRTGDYTFYDIFNQPSDPTSMWRCWGRVTKGFSSQK